MKLMDWNWMTW